MFWTFQANRPVYLQIAERIIADISNSKLSVGAKLPNVRAFASNIGANPNSVAKAFQHLVDNQVLVFVAGEYIVLEPAQAEEIEVAEAVTEQDFEQKKLCAEFIQRMHNLGLSKKEAVTFLCDYLVQDNKINKGENDGNNTTMHKPV